MTIPRKGSGRPCSRKVGRRFWDLGALAVGEYRRVPKGVAVPHASIGIAHKSTGYTFATRRQPDGSTRIYRET